MSTQASRSPVSPDLDLLIRRAAWIGQKGDSPVASFTSLFLSLLSGKDPWSRWAQQTARRTGVTLERVLKRWEETGGRPPEFSLEKLNGPVPAIPQLRFTRSGEALIALSSDVRHLIGVYVYKPSHGEDLAAWGFLQERWAVLFHPRIARLYPPEAALYPHAPYDRPLSIGLSESVRLASQLRDGEPASAGDLLRGVLVEGAGHAADERYPTASAWFLQALGGHVDALLGGPLPARSRLPEDHLPPLDESARELLDAASLLATAALDRRTHIRHLLLAALVSPRFPAPELLKRGHRRAPQLVDELLGWTSGKDMDDEGALRELVALAIAARDVPEERAVILNSDSIGGDKSGIPLDEDRLGISSDVRAMASVLASASLKPPLSVGLFGDWGSGKSFFMGLLRKRIGDLTSRSSAARKAGKPTSFHGDIIQIEFNAWQYMDANLWASITAHIFDQLSAALRESKKPPADEYLAALASVQEEQQALLREKGKLSGEITGVRDRLAELEQQRKEKKLSWSDMGAEILRLREQDASVKDSLDEMARHLGLDRAQLSIEEARGQIKALRDGAGKIAAWARSIRKSPWKAVLVLVPVLIPTVVLLATQKWQSAPAWIGQGVGLLIGLVAFVRQMGAIVGPAFNAFDRAMERADAAESRAREKLTDEERRARADEERLAAEESKLEQKQAELSKRREELESKLTELKEAASYKRFVLDRAASSDYRSQLGLITTIHRDLKTLSEKLQTSEEPHVDRIILYIDDLDRCPPDRVVEVLQAVHLILSLELFVVVVAVDSRWLLQSLEAYYRRHFGERRRREDPGLGHRESDPQHYLEKIFQIPYALPPMTDPGFGTLVEALLGENVVKNVVKTSGKPVTTAELESPGQQATQAPASVQVNPAQPAPAPDLTPRSLEIVEVELKNLQKLGALGSGRLLSSPRAVKRMVNLYRIVRAGLDEGSIDEFLDGRFRLHQLFLAAVVGTPAEAAALLDELFERRVTNRQGLADFLASMRERNDAWRTLDRAFAGEPLIDDWETVLEAARGAARFSFQTGRVLQEAMAATASPGAPAPPPSSTPRPS